MSRILLRLMGLIAIGCGLAVCSSVVTGRMLPGVPVAVFMQATMRADLHITRIDTRLKTSATERIKLAQAPGWIDMDCRVFLLAPSENLIQLIYIDLHNRQQRVYLPSPDFNRTSLASRLPDKRRTWIQYMDAREVVHSLLMDMSTGATIPVEMPQYKALQSSRWLWAPDGEHGLLLLQGMDVAYGYVLTTATGVLTEVEATRRQTAAWSLDGRYLAILSAINQKVTLFDTQTMTAQTQTYDAVALSADVAWSPENDLLFLARNGPEDGDYQGYRWTPGALAPQKVALRLTAQAVEAAAAAGLWSPDAARLAYSDGAQTQILITQNGNVILTLDSAVTGGLWSPDSRYLVDYDRAAGQLIIIDTQTQVITDFEMGLMVLAERWSPDGTELTLFDTMNSRLGRLFLISGGPPELRMDFQFEDADNAAFCYPEMGS